MGELLDTSILPAIFAAAPRVSRLLIYGPVSRVIWPPFPPSSRFSTDWNFLILPVYMLHTLSMTLSITFYYFTFYTSLCLKWFTTLHQYVTTRRKLKPRSEILTITDFTTFEIILYTDKIPFSKDGEKCQKEIYIYKYIQSNHLKQGKEEGERVIDPFD